MLEPTIRAVVYREGDWWIIRCLEYGFVTPVKRLEDVPEQIRMFVLVQVTTSLQHGFEPFHGYAPAPRKYWEMYEKATPWEGQVAPIELPRDLGANPTVEARLAA
jgi:hypothetical protein